MYEELVKRLRYDAELLSQDGWAAGLFMEAADAIEELQHSLDIMGDANAKLRDQAPEWIPVTERLPGYGDWVLGIGPKHGYHVCEYCGITHFPYIGDIPWFSAKGRTLTITHWMPLPEPPEPPKEEYNDRT